MEHNSTYSLRSRAKIKTTKTVGFFLLIGYKCPPSQLLEKKCILWKQESRLLLYFHPFTWTVLNSKLYWKTPTPKEKSSFNGMPTLF